MQEIKTLYKDRNDLYKEFCILFSILFLFYV